MDWIQVASIIFTILGSAYYIHCGIQSDIRTTNERIDQQSARTDRLYEMFCEMQKQMKDEIIQMKKDQYEFMRQERKK